MKIFPEKLIRPATQSSVQNQDLLRQPKVPQNLQTVDPNFSYQKNKIFYRGQDLSSFIKKSTEAHPAVFSQIANELEKYRQDQEKLAKRLMQRHKLTDEKENEIAHILALCEAHLARLAELMQNHYASLSSGCTVEFDEHGQFLLNGINVRQTLNHFQNYPNPRAKVYLKGMANRLYSILNQTHKNRLYFRLQDTIFSLYEEVLSALQAA